MNDVFCFCFDVTRGRRYERGFGDFKSTCDSPNGARSQCKVYTVVQEGDRDKPQCTVYANVQGVRPNLHYYYWRSIPEN